MALAELVVRLVQRSTVKFVVNALVGIGIGWFFVHLAASRGGSADDQALAYFLPGLIYNTGYAVVFGLTCLIGWPLVGFMIGSVTGDPTAWHGDRQIVRLCSQLTWLLVLPCAVRAVVQGPIWLAGHSGSISADTAVATLGVLKVAMGWPLQLACAGRDVVAARSQPHAARGRRQSRCRSGLSSSSSSLSTSAPATNSSSSPASIGCSPSGA